MLDRTIGFLGAGKMGEALARGILRARLALPANVRMSDVDPTRLASLAKALQVLTPGDNRSLVQASEVVIVALKPGVVRQALPELAAAIGRERLVVSIAAGITIAELEGMLAAGARVVRVMPNTPCLVGAGASAYALGSAASAADGEVVRSILDSVGICVEVPEGLLDAVTGLSGSGPAFVALVVEAMADGGVLAGLPRDVANRLAVQTVLGAARLLAETGKRPAELKDMVASPGGTTIEGLKVLEEKRLRAALIQAVEAAAAKSHQLGLRSGNP
ncbi:MAG TPA: pyrroline-5-carboxylate reductase [Planctomycetota bacterium]|nr:pyrroline-5-carboxylate reductase [Planctomycetota bacterium]HRR81423.1 pyrroline-5-carboxylate reductase [Planctomycetota bacterium]